MTPEEGLAYSKLNKWGFPFTLQSSFLLLTAGEQDTGHAIGFSFHMWPPGNHGPRRQLQPQAQAQAQGEGRLRNDWIYL